MIYFFPPAITTIFGLALIGWLAWILLSSAVKQLWNTDVPAESVDISAMQSDSGKSHIEKTCYYPSMKRFYAKVVCQELDYSWNIWADSKEELEEAIQKQFKSCDERIRDRINRRELNKSLYFRIG